MTKNLTSPDGRPITVRPVEPGELDRIPLRCWPERETLDHLFAEQGTIGMAAWEGDKCVAQLHCYRVVSPDGRNQDWPEWSEWWSKHWQLAAGAAGLELIGPVWCHACIHVGRTLEGAQKEFEPSEEAAKGFLKGTNPRYFGRGIGTTLCEASVQWASNHNYIAVLAPGAPDGLFQYATWSGHLPWTTYAKLGFESVKPSQEADELPGWAEGGAPPKVVAEAQAALAAGRPAHEINERWMVLDLRPEVGPASE